MSYYDCSRTTRNGQCKGNPVRHAVGPKHLNLCRRHGKKYDEEQVAVQQRTERQHDQGHHGEGDDRKAFVNATVGEHYVTCQKCQDGMAADELGVPDDQVAIAQKVKRAMDAALKHETDQLKSFADRFTRNAHEALNPGWGYVEDAQEAMALADLYRDVKSYMEDGKYLRGQEYVKLSLVAAYRDKCDSVLDDLISGHMNEEQRIAARKFLAPMQSERRGLL